MERPEILGLFATALAVAALGPALPAGGETGEAAPTQSEEAGAEPEADAAEKAPAEREDATAGGWWNRSQFISTLSLTEAQRQKMDAALTAFRAEATGEGRETLVAFYEALEKGQWKQAEADLEELAKRSAAQMRARGQLKLDVLRALDPEQRAKLLERYPNLVRQQWGPRPGRGQQRGRPR